MRGLVVFLLCFWLTIGLPLPGFAAVDPMELGQAVTEVELLDQMRSGLASSLADNPTTPTIETFRAVCAPVGKRAQEIAKTNGWQVRQVALKYRNPAHKPQNQREEAALEEFSTHPDLQAFWQTDDQATYYFRRIQVEASCLACHGAKDQRPSFISAKYPQDLAYNFAVGDLRGMYEVIIPALKEALGEKE